jgi:hypothetical protein
MAERRPLVDGLKVDPRVEKDFVFAAKPKPMPSEELPAEPVAPRETAGRAANPVSRVPLTTRIRGDFAEALKEASLKRQLEKVSPNTQQDILEEALEPWLRTHGYLS